MNSSSFQVVITLTIVLCIVGIMTAVYNTIMYHHLTKTANINNINRDVQTAEKISIVTGVLFLIALIVIVILLSIHVNNSKCLHLHRTIPKPEIGTAKDLVKLFD